MRKTPIYFDAQATGRIDAEVWAAMTDCAHARYGNPHSEHLHGHWASYVVEEARGKIADFIGAFKSEITLLSGATLANNMVLQGIEPVLQSGRHRILVSAIEHPCVLEPARFMANERGFELVVIPTDREGIVDRHFLLQALDERAALVSVMLANNEIGVLQDIRALAKDAHKVGALFHTDATQAAGRIGIDVLDLDVDYLSFTAHKLYGPTGVGALYVRESATLAPLIHGGHQQRLLSGTLSPELATGFAKACQISTANAEDTRNWYATLCAQFLVGLRSAGYEITLNGPRQMDQRLPGALSLQLNNIDVVDLRAWIGSYVSFSTGSACASQREGKSYVLDAIGLSDEEAERTVRISFSKDTTLEDIDDSIGYFKEYLTRCDEESALLARQ